jgi:hypothetical protein
LTNGSRNTPGKHPVRQHLSLSLSLSSSTTTDDEKKTQKKLTKVVIYKKISLGLFFPSHHPSPIHPDRDVRESASKKLFTLARELLNRLPSLSVFFNFFPLLPSPSLPIAHSLTLQKSEIFYAASWKKKNSEEIN